MGKRNKGHRNGMQRTEEKFRKKVEKRKQKKRADYEKELDTMIATFARANTVQCAEAGRPTPRSGASFVVHPSNDNAIVMFGGEFHTDGKQTYYNDMYIYRVDKKSWQHITFPDAPLPRSSHQCVAAKIGGQNLMFLFGGEFATPNGDKFRHFKDFWVCDLDKRQWTEITPKTILAASETPSATKKDVPWPSARSGHRMCLYKKSIVLFGGFFDSNDKLTYYNDLWVYDVLGQAWACYVPHVGSALALAHLAPAPRSGAVCGVIDSEFYVIGGFSQVVAKAKAPKKRLEEDDDEDRNGIAHQDIWKINLDKLEEGWTKVKIGTDIMPAKRSSATGFVYKKRIMYFGGVSDIAKADDDEDGDEEDKETSVYRNDLWMFSAEKNRWFVINVKKPETVPSPRFACSSIIAKNFFYIFGGMIEVDRGELIYDDFYRLDLTKIAEFEQLLASTTKPEKDEEDEDEKEENDGEEDEEDEDEDDEDEDEEEGEEEEEDDDDENESEDEDEHGSKKDMTEEKEKK